MKGKAVADFQAVASERFGGQKGQHFESNVKFFTVRVNSVKLLCLSTVRSVERHRKR